MTSNTLQLQLNQLSSLWRWSGWILIFISILALMGMSAFISFEVTHTRAVWIIFFMAFLFGLLLDIMLFPATSALTGRFSWARQYILIYSVLVFASVPFWLGLLTVRLLPGNSLLGFYFLYGGLAILVISILLQVIKPFGTGIRIRSMIALILPFGLATSAVIWVSLASLGDRSVLQGMENGLWLVNIRVEGENEILTHYPFFILYLIPLMYRFGLGFYTLIKLTPQSMNTVFNTQIIASKQNFSEIRN